MEAAKGRLLRLLQLRDDPSSGLSAEIKLAPSLLAVLDRTDCDGSMTTFETALDALNAEIQELTARHKDHLRELAQLAGESSLLVQRNRHAEAMTAIQAAHQLEKKTIAEFTNLQLRSAATDSPATTPFDVSSAALRQLQGLDVGAGKMPVSALFAAYCEAHRGEWKDWDDRVKRDYNPVRDALIRMIGDVPIEELTVARSRQFTGEIKASAIAGGRKMSTAAKKVDYLKSVLRWAHEQAMLPDLTGPLRVKADAERYEAFSAAELKTMFESDDFRRNRFGRASRFWLPLLALYTGARLEELAGMHLSQISMFEGVPAVELSPGGKSTGKNAFSRRRVPIHRALLACGFLGYVDVLQDEGFEELFPCTPEAARDGRGKAATRDFQQFRRSLGIGAEEGRGRGTKVFHSFRATLTTAMQSVGVSQEVRETITGHAKTGTHARIYSQGNLPMSELVKALHAVSFESSKFSERKVGARTQQDASGAEN